jgi:hypothetical protein
MYGPIAAGPYGACEEIYPKRQEPSRLCDCGAPVAQHDWLCPKCRERLYSDEVQEAVARYTEGEEEAEQPQQGRLWEEEDV